jgi:hypothetical protein
MPEDTETLIEELEGFLSAGGEPLEPIKIVREIRIGAFLLFRETHYCPREGDSSDPCITIERWKPSLDLIRDKTLEFSTQWRIEN